MGNFYEERRRMRLGQVERMLDSDVTVAEWCKLNHVAESTMYHWLKVYREDSGGDGRRNGWIELDRKDVRESKALAVASPHAAASGAAAPEPACAAQRHSQAIRVRVGGVEADIPAGAAQADIEAVLRAVAAL